MDFSPYEPFILFHLFAAASITFAHFGISALLAISAMPRLPPARTARQS
jgi:hypothetical protein